MTRALALHGERRIDAIVGAALLAVTLVAAFGLPGHPPLDVVLGGVANGFRFALVAASIYLVYRTSRVVNFAALAMGALATEVFVDLAGVGLAGLGPVSFWVALPLALLLGAGVGAITELVFVRRFFGSPRIVLTVVTIVAMPTISGFAGKLASMPIWRQDRESQLVKRELDLLPLPWGDATVGLGGIRVGTGRVLSIVTTVVALAALAWFLQRTRTGAALRGSAENADRALLLGINVRLLSTLVWSLAALLTSIAVLLHLFDLRQHVGAGVSGAAFGATLLPPLAAVAIARLRSLTVTCLAAVMLGVVRVAVDWSLPGTEWTEYVTFLALFAALLLQRGSYSRDDRALAATWEGAREVRPTPRELLALPSIRFTRRAAIAAGAVLLLVFPQVVSTDQARVGGVVAMNVILALSLVVMTGWGGQISLGQIAFFGIAAFAAGWLGDSANVPFWLVVPLVVALTALVAIPIGQVALRVRGPYLPVVTLAFAWAWYALAFRSPALDGIRADSLTRPRLFTVSLASERAYYYVCVVAAVLCVLLVRRLRVSRLGRLLLAIRDDEYGVQPFGVSAARTRTAVFAISGGLAGLAGVLMAYQLAVLPEPSGGDDIPGFGLTSAVDLLVMVVVGGLSSITGAVLGAVYVGVSQLLVADPELRRLATDSGLLALLLIAPGGLSQVAYGARDAVLRLVALRRRMVVPSLFTDRDPADVLAQRTPIAPPDARERATRRRYALPSDVYPTTTESAKPVVEAIPS